MKIKDDKKIKISPNFNEKVIFLYNSRNILYVKIYKCHVMSIY